MTELKLSTARSRSAALRRGLTTLTACLLAGCVAAEEFAMLGDDDGPDWALPVGAPPPSIELATPASAYEGASASVTVTLPVPAGPPPTRC